MGYEFVENNKKQGFLYLFMLLTYNIVSLFVALILVIIKAEGLFAVIISSLTSPIAFTITGLFFKSQARASLETIKSRFSFKLLIFSLMIAIGMLFAFGYLNIIFGNFLNQIGLKSSASSIKVASLTDYLLLTLFVGVVPAVFEEFFFRGMFLNSLKPFGAVFSLIISSVCFSLYHGSVSMLLYQFIYGLVLGLIFYQTDNLIYGIIIHFVNNFTVLSFEYFGIFLIDQWYIIVVGFILVIGGILGIVNQRKVKLTPGKNAKKDFFVPYGILAILLAVLTVLLGALL